MASRESSDTTSSSGKSYPAGSAASAATSTIRGISISKHADASSFSKVAVNAANPVEIHADFAVWDTVAQKYLFPGRDFNPGDIQRK